MQKTYLEDRLTIGQVKEKLNDSGHLEIKGKPARIGVQIYHDELGEEIRVLRPEASVKGSLDSFNMIPITLNHPAEEQQVSVFNSETEIKGFGAYPEYNDGYIEQRYLITHQDAILAATSSHQELSVGYFAEISLESGIWTDTFGVQGDRGLQYEYDAVQTNIQANHVALVVEGRAGKKARLLFDNIKDYINNNSSMSTFVYKDEALTVEGKDSEKVVALFKELSKDYATLNDSVEKLTTENQNLTEAKAILDSKEGEHLGVIEQLKAEIETLKSQTVTNDEIAAKLALWDLIKPFIDSESIDYSLDIAEIQKLYLLKQAPNLKEKLSDASTEFIAGMWACLHPNKQEKEAKKETPNYLDSLNFAVNNSTQDSTGISVIEQARQKAIARKEYKN